MACRTGCPTQNHESWGDCARASGMRISYCQSHKGRDATAQKDWDNELALYRSAVRQGMEPDSTRTPDIRAAIEASNETGIGYGTDAWKSKAKNRALELSA